MPSPFKNLTLSVAAGAGTKPEAPAFVPSAPVKTLYVVSAAHVASPLKNLPCAPAGGATTRPLAPAAPELAAVKLLYVVLGDVNVITKLPSLLGSVNSVPKLPVAVTNFIESPLATTLDP